MKKGLAIILCLILLSQSVFAAGSAEDAHQQALEAYKGYLRLSGIGNQELLSLGNDFPAGSSVCDWTAFGISLLGTEKTSAYLSALRQYATDRLSDSSVERSQATEWHRVALTALALGADPTHFGVHNELDLIALGTYNFGGSSLGITGLNGWIWALLALDSGDYAVPDNARFSRETILSAIVEAQEPDGGFGLMKGVSDIDITAMALQALAPYREQYSEVVNRALHYLSASMENSGDYCYGGTRNSESGAQVIMALCALGIDPETDSRFIRNGVTLVDGLRSYQQSDGSYAHEFTDEKGNFLATEHAMRAFLSLERLRNGQGSLYHFSSHEAASQNSTTVWIIAAGAGVIVAIILILGRRKKHE